MKSVSYAINNILDACNKEDGLWIGNTRKGIEVSEKKEIENLFDLIISGNTILDNILILEIEEPCFSRKFIANYWSDLNLKKFFQKRNSQKTLLLCNGQSLQDIYIGLKGSYDKQELYFNVISSSSQNSKTTNKFKFLPYPYIEKTGVWIKAKDLINSEVNPDKIIKKIGNKIPENVISKKYDLIKANIQSFINEFSIKKNAHIKIINVNN
ncbi:protein of unknown function DUF262 [Flexistipes sinusarabici DSM 4947]|uniref:Uncharacterized protein n=1 Tax=Flexistipes sinusarabici (strain ATCC 49648 / DSM 4947 / MAS 10) TaxID=717231 RepID=F8E931_FLESM|nr:hypothetical protein [Flexistipes sinusarabici]AEI15233.1 protein of unknown function DUF262 [Flexistipes sinusarabici DSM 4947]